MRRRARPAALSVTTPPRAAGVAAFQLQFQASPRTQHLLHSRKRRLCSSGGLLLANAGIGDPSSPPLSYASSAHPQRRARPRKRYVRTGAGGLERHRAAAAPPPRRRLAKMAAVLRLAAAHGGSAMALVLSVAALDHLRHRLRSKPRRRRADAPAGAGGPAAAAAAAPPVYGPALLDPEELDSSSPEAFYLPGTALAGRRCRARAHRQLCRSSPCLLPGCCIACARVCSSIHCLCVCSPIHSLQTPATKPSPTASRSSRAAACRCTARCWRRAPPCCLSCLWRRARPWAAAAAAARRRGRTRASCCQLRLRPCFLCPVALRGSRQLRDACHACLPSPPPRPDRSPWSCRLRLPAARCWRPPSFCVSCTRRTRPRPAACARCTSERPALPCPARLA